MQENIGVLIYVTCYQVVCSQKSKDLRHCMTKIWSSFDEGNIKSFRIDAYVKKINKS